ncbi:MAG: hypothetical protein EOO31_01230 [Comamonadaceae bacterium]|nr:MAG: hypothetical protein EOO31_01230 [Comamonadaceae bacterium]
MATHRFKFPLRWCGLSLAALLAACGGGGGGSNSGGSDNAGGGAAGTVAVSLTAPVAEEVFDASAPLTVSARVTVNGTNAADGTSVSFSTTPAGGAATGVTRDGVATATLTATAAGRQQINATASVSGQSATAARVVYLRPTPARLEVLVPAYFYPSANSPWDRLATGAAAYPSVSITAIMNPDNGVFTAADPAFAAAAGRFVAAGGKVLGYVYTSYGTGSRSLSAIKANIDSYLSLYGRGVIGGIFLDEMASETSRLPFYRELYAYIKSKDASLRVVGNPGMVPASEFAEVADVLVTFEGKSSTFESYDPRQSGAWLYARSNASQSSLVHNAATCAAMQQAVKSAASARYNAGPIFITSLEYDPVTGVGNPWNGLPAYWNAMLQTVDALNKGSTLPAC